MLKNVNNKTFLCRCRLLWRVKNSTINKIFVLWVCRYRKGGAVVELPTQHPHFFNIFLLCVIILISYILFLILMN